MENKRCECWLLASRGGDLCRSPRAMLWWRFSQRIQAELSRSTKRVYLMKPKVLAGHYVSTDNAILLVAICASVGVGAGVLGGAFMFKA